MRKTAKYADIICAANNSGRHRADYVIQEKIINEMRKELYHESPVFAYWHSKNRYFFYPVIFKREPENVRAAWILFSEAAA